ncbi:MULTISPECIES: DUF3800 domain-containing protein [unclassified Streptomyces]|uniref:DUF3800 domain-containing protein n=1 Tax=unclassified Streptomyces TaxID=2593676 RepID=UPI00093CA938|nr:DUF3800 domain-containing protein [Streptomyces sp. TSRI0107]OKJ88018.1 hypothetical protein AMK31_12930 [Streptomyces sp. TSRI0107]
MTITPAAAPLRLYYVDDSGDGRRLVSFAALGIDLAHTADAQATWLGFRAELAADARLLIPATAPLHSHELAGVRGRYVHRARSSDREQHRRHSREVILRGLHTVARLTGVRVRAVYRETDDYAHDRPGLYAALLRQIQAELAATGHHGVLIVDGDGTEDSLRRAHRNLPDDGRRIIGDPLFLPARENHLLQAADIVAYAAHQNVAKQENRRFMWDWFGAVLPGADGPRAL